MEKGTPVTIFSALNTSTKPLGRLRKPDDQVKFFSNYIDVYQRLKKFYKFGHITLKLQYIGFIILLGYSKTKIQ